VLLFLEAVTHHCKPRELTVAMAAAYDLDEAGIAFVTGSGESTNKVASIAEDAQSAPRGADGGPRRGRAFAGGRHAADDLGASDGETTNASGTASSSGDDDGDADGTTDGDGSDANDGNDDDDDGQAGLSDFV